MANDPSRVSGQLEVQNRLGLHARAASKLVHCASAYEAEITLTRGSREANAKSIMSVMMLAAAKGTKLDAAAHGPQAAEAMQALQALFDDRFGEDE